MLSDAKFRFFIAAYLILILDRVFDEAKNRTKPLEILQRTMLAKPIAKLPFFIAVHFEYLRHNNILTADYFCDYGSHVDETGILRASVVNSAPGKKILNASGNWVVRSGRNHSLGHSPLVQIDLRCIAVIDKNNLTGGSRR